MEMKTEYLGIAGQLLTTLGTQIPLLGVWVAGAVLAAAFWQRDPRRSLLVLLACLLSLLDVVVFGVFYAVGPMMLRSGMNAGGFNLRLIYPGLGFVRACILAAAWILMLVAVFRRRLATQDRQMMNDINHQECFETGCAKRKD